ncbi:MAG: polysaccharide biosynthesis protein [Candidatus Marinamargulisbacteria bacterium]
MNSYDDITSFLLLTYVAIGLCKVTLFYGFKLYAISWRYASLGDIRKSFRMIVLSSLLLGLANIPLDIIHGSWVILDFFLFNTLFFCSRFFIRIVRKTAHLNPPQTQKSIVIIGAGDAGEMIARELTKSHKKPVIHGFFDDNKNNHNKTIHQVPVIGAIQDLPDYVKHHPIDQIIIAVPSANKDEFRRIDSMCKSTQIPYQTTPSIHELIDGSVQLNTLRDVSILDLLGRAQINIDSSKIESRIANKTVLITGAGGSIGSELSRQIIQFKPKKIILLDHSEYHLYTILNEINAITTDTNIQIIPACLDIKSVTSLTKLFNELKPNIVFHSAAYKHVPLMEINADQAILNNIGGTKNVLDACDATNVNQCVVISTDKAVEPSNAMGATKRICELMTLNKAKESNTRFSCVRFGNVLGSYGSVIPLFKNQIKRGGPITITDPNMTRYFMTIKEAVSLVFEASTMVTTGGELFVLDMGKAIGIVDLAMDLIRLSGLTTDDINITYTGLRPGEKLNEKLFYDFEIPQPSSHPKINCCTPQLNASIKNDIDTVLSSATMEVSNEQCAALLKKAVAAINATFDSKKKGAFNT